MLVIVVAIFAPIIWGPAAEVMDTTNINAGPSAEHLIGTDALGRDLLLRTLVATRLTILLALGATAIALAIGIVLGAAPLLFGRPVGRVAITAVNIAIAFPAILLALCLATILGIGAFAAMAAIGIAGAPSFARFCQTLIAGVTNRDYIAAARIAGAGRFTILFRHVLPNIAEPLIVNATIAAGGALLAFAGLSFLGLGVQSPDYDWGRLMNEGLSRIYLNPLAALAPGLAVVITGLAFNLTGEAMAKTFSLPTMSCVPGFRVRRGEKAAASTDAVSASAAPVSTPHATPTSSSTSRISDVSLPSGVEPVRGVDLRIGRQEAVGIVGESGSGKSLTALAVAQLLESPLTVTADALTLLGNDLRAEPATRAAEDERRHLLGTSVSVVFQDPMTSLNPTMKIGTQLAEVPRTHSGMSWRAALDYAAQRLEAVGIPDHRRRAKQYPHEFSGGMRQRAMIAMSIMAQPKLVIADEPTTALDVTVQQQVLAAPGPHPAGERRGDPAHQPRHRGRPRGHRPDPGHVRRPGRRGDRLRAPRDGRRPPLHACARRRRPRPRHRP